MSTTFDDVDNIAGFKVLECFYKLKLKYQYAAFWTTVYVKKPNKYLYFNLSAVHVFWLYACVVLCTNAYMCTYKCACLVVFVKVYVYVYLSGYVNTMPSHWYRRAFSIIQKFFCWMWKCISRDYVRIGIFSKNILAQCNYPLQLT